MTKRMTEKTFTAYKLIALLSRMDTKLETIKAGGRQ